MAGEANAGVRVQVRELARRLYDSIAKARPKLDTTTAGILSGRVLDGDAAWAVSTMLAIWRLSNQDKWKPALDILLRAGGRKLASDLEAVAPFLPDPFRRWLEVCQQASSDAELAGAAIFFAAAITELNANGRIALLHKWLRDPLFREVGQNLIKQFPPPGSERPSTEQERGASRGARFDRKDYEQRQPARSASTPNLESEDVARVHLAGLGWDSATIDQILSRKRIG